LSDEELKTLIETAVLHSPSSINMQNSRVLLVLGDMHHKVWDMVIEEQRKLYPNDRECTVIDVNKYAC
jgi:predicted oxidoreductase (fatty acid repression mutant protein)